MVADRRCMTHLPLAGRREAGLGACDRRGDLVAPLERFMLLRRHKIALQEHFLAALTAPRRWRSSQ